MVVAIAAHATCRSYSGCQPQRASIAQPCLTISIGQSLRITSVPAAFLCLRIVFGRRGETYGPIFLIYSTCQVGLNWKHLWLLEWSIAQVVVVGKSEGIMTTVMPKVYIASLSYRILGLVTQLAGRNRK